MATVPSGASTGTHEADERRDGGARYGGKGVRNAVAAVNGEIADAIRGLSPEDQEAIDRRLRELDGTPSLQRLGANAVLAASVACAVAAAAGRGLPLWRALAPDLPPLLPLPMVNVVSGGAHAGGLVDVQDVLVVPVGATTFAEAIEWSHRVRTGTADVLREREHDTALVADEGGLAAPLGSNREAVEVVAEGIERSGLVPGEQAAIAVDVAATQLGEGDAYRLASEGRVLEPAELVAELRSGATTSRSCRSRIRSAKTIGRAGGSRANVFPTSNSSATTSSSPLPSGCGRVLPTASPTRCSSSPTRSVPCPTPLGVVELARAAGYATVLSARSGETEDAWLADLAVGWRTGQLKVGSTTRSERTAKWNRLLRIEAEHPDAEFAGRRALAPLRPV